jgi:hypothetical protein
MVSPMCPAQPNPDTIDALHWHHAQGVARQACARVFRDGGQPADAVQAFGVALGSDTAAAHKLDWSRAVGLITESLCRLPKIPAQIPMKHAA